VNRGRTQAGFTLLEVLVALAVMSIGAALTMGLVSGALGNIRKVQLRTRAIQHAETVLEIALLDDSVKRPTTLRGDFEDGTRWSVQIDEYEPAPDVRTAMMTADQLQRIATYPIKLLTYTVEVMSPDSIAPDFRLQTLKLVNSVDPLNPIGIRR
jgi:prepilin-type N-terminal cleavage/methylation domain-containing protein